MEIKYTIQGLLIYFAMFLYLSAFIASAAGRKKTGQAIYSAGFIIAAVAFGYRWHHVGHPPFQNMFEIFLSMGMMIYPISIFCRKMLGVGGEAIDMLLGVILLFPAGFVFNAGPQMLPPALQSWLFIPHIAAYLISYVIMTKAAVQAVCRLSENNFEHEESTYRMIFLGFPLLTLGLILGSWWGQLAWGDYWGWDPKELWSLASWLIYLLYFHFRYTFGKKSKISSGLVIAGFTAIVITLLWVNLSRIFAGMHNYAT
jgi:ABC-type transport system involved in cytochrome c biogenesis permease subunit